MRVIMRQSWSIIKLIMVFYGITVSSLAWATPYAPTSFELLYQPTYTMAIGGPTAQLGLAGGGVRIGFEMTPLIAFELGGYYNGYVFGDIIGTNQTLYAARATGDFAFAPSQAFRIYLGADANVCFNLPSILTSTDNKDIGIIGGFRVLVGGGTKVVLGAEYRYPLATAYTYVGGSINTAAVIGTIGLHFGGL
jgi:hypothetical protein